MRFGVYLGVEKERKPKGPKKAKEPANYPPSEHSSLLVASEPFFAYTPTYHTTVSHGINPAILMKLQSSINFTQQEMATTMGLSLRSFQRMSEKPVLDSNTSERTLLLAKLLAHGKALFGSDAKFQLWMRSPLFALGGKAPIDIISTIAGLQLADSTLTKIEEGIFA